MLKVGLTGNIGSGKTLVSEIFRILAVPVFQADTAAKDLYSSREVRSSLSKIFGDVIFHEDGSLERAKMAELMFSDEEMVKKVNALIHPMVRDSFSRWSSEHSYHPYVIYEAAILVESGYYTGLDQLIFVSAPEEVRIARVISRDKVTREQVLMRMQRQWPEEKKIPLADWVIRNDNSEMIIPVIMEIDRELREMAMHKQD